MRPDAVVFDLNVRRGLGGIEAMRRIREAHPTARGIAASGMALDATDPELVAAGFSAVLAKPFSPEQIEDALARVLE